MRTAVRVQDTKLLGSTAMFSEPNPDNTWAALFKFPLVFNQFPVC